MSTASQSHQKEMTFLEHLDELRRCLLKSCIFVFLFSLVIWNFSGTIVEWIIKPVGRVVFTDLSEAFSVRLKVSVWGGLFFSSPIIFYQLWKFVSSGIAQNQKKPISLLVPLSVTLFIVGMCFGYFAVIPVGVKFLLGFASENITAMISIGSYVSFVLGISLIFGAVFQMPLVVVFGVKTGFLDRGVLISHRRHAVVIMFIVAGLLTPPDIMSQFLMAVPLLAMYELGIFLSRFFMRGDFKKC